MLFDEGVDAELDEELRPELNRLLEMKKTLPEIGVTSGKLRGIMRPLESYIWKAYTNWCEM